MFKKYFKTKEEAEEALIATKTEYLNGIDDSQDHSQTRLIDLVNGYERNFNSRINFIEAEIENLKRDMVAFFEHIKDVLK